MSLSIIIGGDIVPSFENLSAFEKGEKSKIISDDCFELIDKADLRIYNLETPITNKLSPVDKDGANFAISEKCIEGIKELKADALCLANNHCLDQGEEGLVKTIEIIEENGIKAFGVGRGKHPENIAYFNVKGYKISIIACAEREFTISDDDKFGAMIYHDYWTNKLISSAKENSDFVIVLYHGGKEYFQFVAPYQKERCHIMADAGADVIVCQHSHCIGCAEEFNGTTILYGQGNFIFHQKNNKPITKKGLITKITISNDKKDIEFIPVAIDEKDRLCLLKDEDKKKILEDMQDRSMQIQDDFICKKIYSCFAMEMYESYKTLIRKRTFIDKVRGKLCKNINNRRLTKKQRLKILNVLQNEAHREVLISAIEQDIRRK